MTTTNPDPRIAQLERSLHELVDARQALRAAGADALALERNRHEIVTRQHELADALIALYAPQVRAA